jgi:uncharacterized protein
MKVAAILASLLFVMQASENYQTEIENWRKESEAKLKSETGWLSVAGLFWLEKGNNEISPSSEAVVRLPEGSLDGNLGVIQFADGKARLIPTRMVQVNGKETDQPVDLQSDENQAKPDVVKINARLSFFVIKRGQRWAVRLRDLESPMRREFTHKTWMPIDPQFRVVADWTAYPTGHTIPVPNILNETEQLPAPGKATFVIDGKTLSLEPVIEEGQYFFIFRDQTAGKGTYPAGRFFYAEAPKDGKIVLDFNKSYNPPCAFTPFATCPLPPKQNQLPIKIQAGELNYGDH